MHHRHRLPAVLVAAASSAFAIAQVPLGYVVVAESVQLPDTPIRYIEPATGVVTDLRTGGASAVLVFGALSVDPTDPTRLYTAPLLSTSIAATLMWYDLQGSRYIGLRRAVVPGAAGVPRRIWALSPSAVLVTIPGMNGGLFNVDTAASTAARLVQMNDATDIAVIGNLAYFNTYRSGQPSTVVEVDLTSGQSRTVGTNMPTIRSLGVFAGAQLLGGTDSGDLVLIDPATGNTTLLLAPNAGAVIAIATDPLSMLPYFATDRNEVHFFGSPGTPIYTTTNTLRDIDVGVHALPSHLQFGDGCTGSNGQLPTFSYVDVPALGQSYTLAVTGGIPGAGAFLAAGFSRTTFNTGAPLPLPLSALLPGAGATCQVQTDVFTAILRTIGINGSASFVLTLPNDPLLSGQHVVWQWLLLDAMAPGGAVISDGAESIVR